MPNSLWSPVRGLLRLFPCLEQLIILQFLTISYVFVAVFPRLERNLMLVGFSVKTEKIVKPELSFI